MTEQPEHFGGFLRELQAATVGKPLDFDEIHQIIVDLLAKYVADGRLTLKKGRSVEHLVDAIHMDMERKRKERVGGA